MVDLASLPSTLSVEEKREILAILEEKARRESRRKILTYYPEQGPLSRHNYPKHMTFFRAGKDYPERCVMAANRVGKTEGMTGYELACHLTGLYPTWWEGRRFDQPVRAWAAGTTAETTRDILQRKLLGSLDNLGTGLIPGDCIIGEPRKDSGIPDAVETVAIKHVPTGGTSRLQFKAYKQGRKSFEGDEQDIVVLDEEPPIDIYGECVIRTMTTNGIIMLGFTPLEGLTETVLSFAPGGIAISPEGRGVGRKFIIGATWDDAPHLSEDVKQSLIGDTPPHMVSARSKGIPSIGSGAIYPIDIDDLLVKDFETPDYWPKVYGFDVGWNATAAVWGEWDRENDIVYVTGEYKRGKAEPETHVRAVKSRGEWIPGVADPASMASSQRDGSKLMEEYVDLGLDLTPAMNVVEAGLFEVYKRMTTGRFKVFKSCTMWQEEFHIYRRDKNGKVVKEFDHLMDCTRYMVISGLGVAKVKLVTKFRNMSVGAIMDRVPLGAI